jgi:hypothetical protein
LFALYARLQAERAMPAAEPVDPKAAAELRSRTLHWKQQRQALLAKKAQERERALQEYERVRARAGLGRVRSGV